MHKRQSDAREVLARYTVGMCLAESEKQGLALAMLEFANRPAADLEAVKEACAKVCEDAASTLRERRTLPENASIRVAMMQNADTLTDTATAIRSLDLSALSCAGEGK